MATATPPATTNPETKDSYWLITCEGKIVHVGANREEVDATMKVHAEMETFKGLGITIEAYKAAYAKTLAKYALKKGSIKIED